MRINRDQIIDVLERSCDFHYNDTDQRCYGCYFENDICNEDKIRERVIELLKEQEPVKPTRSEGTTWWFKCGKCGMSLDPRDKFCRECGRTIEWN